MKNVIVTDTEKFWDIYAKSCKDPKNVSDIIYWNRSETNRMGEGYSFFQNLMTGKRSKKLKDVLRQETRNIYMDDYQEGLIFGYYVEYDEEHDVVVAYDCNFNKSLRVVEGQERNWDNMEPVYVFTRNGECYQNGNIERASYYDFLINSYRYYDIAEETLICYGDDVENIFSGSTIKLCRHSVDTMKKIYGNGFCYGTNSYHMLAGNANFPFPKFHEIEKSVVCDVDDEEKEDFTSKELPPVDEKYLKEIASYYSVSGYFKKDAMRKFQESNYNFGIVQHVEEGLSVIRIFGSCIYAKDIVEPGKVDTEYLLKCLDIHEHARVYVKGYERPVLYKNYFGKWKRTDDSTNVFCAVMFPWKPEDSKGTLLSYMDKYFKERYENARNGRVTSLSYTDVFELSDDLMDVIMDQYVNNIFSSKFVNTQDFIMKTMEALSICFSSALCKMFNNHSIPMNNGEWNSNLIHDVGYPAHMFVTMNDIYGLALKQIRELETVIGEKIGADVYEERKDVNSRVEIASNLFATIVSYFEPTPEYLKNMNAEQFRELAMTTYRCMLDSTDNFDIKADDLRNTAIKNLVHIRGPKQILSYVKYVYGNLTDILERKKITTGMVGMFDTYSNYIDYIKMATYLFDADYRLEDFQYRFRTAEEINTAHDNTMQVYNLVYDQKNFEVQQGKFDTVWTKEKKEQFSFTGNIFSVITPKNVLEIAHEGDALHHCVKSYIDSVVDGRTNILFVRRNEDLEKPFYTLEIQHDRIRQCHGFGNCNVDEEEGLEDFLKTYCEEKKFDFFNPDRVLAAGGR